MVCNDKRRNIMRQIAVALLAGLTMIACVNNDQSVYLKKFVPPDESCKVSIDSELWYETGYLDIMMASNYELIFYIKNEMARSATMNQGSELAPIDTAESNYWRMEWVELSYDVPPITDFNPTVWGDRDAVSRIIVDANGGEMIGGVYLLTKEQYQNLIEMHNATPDFDWNTYPIIISVAARGVKQGGGNEIKTNALKFNLVPTYAKMIQQGWGYPEPENTQPQEEINEMPEGKAKDDAQKARDKRIYKPIVDNCVFGSSPVSGCIIGRDWALINCYAGTFTSVDGKKDITAAKLLEGMFKGYKCCPLEKPTAPEEEETKYSK